MSWPAIIFAILIVAVIASGIWSIVQQSQRRPEDDYSNLSDAL